MPKIYFKSVPFSKEAVTLALESGVDGIITDAAHMEGVRKLALCDVFSADELPSAELSSKADEENLARRIAAGETIALRRRLGNHPRGKPAGPAGRGPTAGPRNSLAVPKRGLRRASLNAAFS